ncbi:MAG: hypothetical protein ACRC5R_03115 [Mycoplasmatales bacterium]
MRIIVGVLLVVTLFAFLAVAGYYNRKTKQEEGFVLKGYRSMCKDCSSDNCPIRQEDYEQEKEWILYL